MNGRFPLADEEQAVALGLAVLASLLGMYVPVRRAARANVVTVLREAV